MAKKSTTNTAKKTARKPKKLDGRKHSPARGFKRGRKKDFSVKQSTVLKTLRDEIIKGYFPPGGQIPTRDDMEKRFKASRVTIQRAFHELIRENFVIPRGRNGTFVSSTPPHLYTYALLFPPDVRIGRESDSFLTALHKEANYRTVEGPQRVLYFGQIRNMTDYRWYGTLFEALKVRQYAGLILIGGDNEFSRSVLQDFPKYPHIYLCNTSSASEKPRVEMDKEAFFKKAFERLDGQHRSRVALICGSEDWAADMAIFNRFVENYKFETRDPWIYHVARQTQGVMSGILQFMMGGGPAQRPDALILTDETLVNEVLKVLDGLSIRPSKDLTLITQSFFPWTLSKSKAVLRLGFDLRAGMESCYQMVNRQFHGEKIPSRTRIAPEFEDVRNREIKGVRPAKRRRRTKPSTKR